MDEYKEYLYEMSKVQYKNPYIMVSWMYPPRLLKRYIPMVMNLPFEESNYHTYYGRVKIACTGCLNCYSQCLTDTEALVDKFTQVLSLSELKLLAARTFEIHDSYHNEVLKEFQPINSEIEQKHLREIISTYNNFKEKLKTFCECIYKMYKRDEVEEFAKQHLEKCLEVIHDTGECTRAFMARIICSKLDRLEICLEEILQRIKNNSEHFKQRCDEGLQKLYHEMYEQNKKNLKLRRSEVSDFQQTREIEQQIATMRYKIMNFVNVETSRRLESEMKFWSQLLDYFNETASIVKKVKMGLDRAKKRKEIHQLYKNDADQRSCWHAVDKALDCNIADLETKYKQACIPITTTFSSPGCDRVLHEDHVGEYFVDNFGHSNYVIDYATRFFHIICDGQWVENSSDAKYYFDECGRYIVEDGKKLYQLAHCTPKYNLTNQGLFRSMLPCLCDDPECKHKYDACIKELHRLPGHMPKMPKATPVDIRGTLSSDDVNYLWDSFGYLLPEVLSELSDSLKNPIHTIAHLLLTKANDMSADEKATRMKEAKQYRDAILNKRLAESAAFLSARQKRLMKSGKLEGSGLSKNMADVVIGNTHQEDDDFNMADIVIGNILQEDTDFFFQDELQ